MEIYGMTGERLGVIGFQQPQNLPLELPKWKEEFFAKPSASIRRGIAWSYDPPFEDTDTLVLTAPSGEFVDVRFPKDVSSANDISNHLSFWAFSGRMTTTFYEMSEGKHAVDMPYTAHCKFSHTIDSRGIPIVDEGDMFLLQNGDCVEMGIMENPVNGTKQLYKEYWHSAEPLPGSDGEEEDPICVVAHIISPALTQGTVIRFGGRVQGITQKQTSEGGRMVGVERWIRDRTTPLSTPIDSRGGDFPSGPWSRDIRSSGFLPGSWLCSPGRTVGDEFEFEGVTWRISEVC